MSRPPLPLKKLSDAFRQRGALMEDISPEAARAFAFCAAWLDESMEAALDEALSLSDAAEESGWSYEGLRQKIADNPALNAAKSGAPQIRRRDLPLLGAARGPRGTYTRKPKDPNAAPTPRAEGVARKKRVSSAQQQTAGTGAPSQPAAEPTTAPCVEHTQRHGVAVSQLDDATDSRPAETDSSPLATEDARNVPLVATDDALPGATPVTRTPRRRNRRDSTSERFRDLCVRASRS